MNNTLPLELRPPRRFSDCGLNTWLSTELCAFGCTNLTTSLGATLKLCQLICVRAAPEVTVSTAGA